MPATPRTPPRPRFALVPAILFAVALGLTVQAQPPEPKKPADPKADKAAPAPKELPGVRLADGTFLWTGDDQSVTLTPQELQKLQDQVEQLKKQLAARKAVPPSGCAVRGRVEKRGDQLVAVLRFTCTFRTTAPKTAVALGGRKGFLVAAALDGGKLPVLDTAEDGFAALVEAAGDHTLTLDLEAPVTSRGAKPELGFEVGLPRAAITTLLFDPPGPDVARVNLTTRGPEVRRVPALDVAQLAPRPGHEGGYPLGPAESVEVTWDPPAASAQPADQVQSAELDVSVLLTEGVVETTAKVRLRGPARGWKLVAPAAASVTADRAAGSADVGPAQPPTVAKPSGSNKTEWKIEFPVGSAAADWVVTAVTRQPRAKPEDAKHRGPFAVGPFAVPDVLRQTGTVRVTAGPNTRFVFKHGPDLRRDAPPGLAEDDVTTAFFRLTTGPTGAAQVAAPLLTVEAVRLPGRVAVRPTYKLTLTEAGWKVRAEVRVIPIGTEVDAVAVEIPAEWRGPDASPAELVEGVRTGNAPDGFWATLAGQLGGGLRVPVVVQLAAGQRQPFDLILTATVPVAPGAAEAAVPLPRFPGATEREASVTATVPDGLEVRGEAREWEGERPAAWGTALAAAPGVRPGQAVTTVTGKADGGLARAALAWQPHRPDLAADVRADVTVSDRQVVVQQVVRLRSPDGLPRPVRFHGPPAAGVKVLPAQFVLDPVGPGEWTFTPPADAKDVTLRIEFGVPLPPAPAGDARPVPVGLLWPAGATRADTTVRVWSNATRGRSLANLSTGWRELPVEPVPDRDALPALVLAASGGEAPLVLEAREAGGGDAVSVWVDRGLIQAWAADDGPTRYRARFVLRRWLAPAAEVRLPGPPAGQTPEFFRDGQKIDVTPTTDAGAGDRGYLIPLPEARPGRTVVVEVRYQFPVARGTDPAYHPPLLPGAAFAGPVRWQVVVPPGAVPLLTGGANAEFRWRWGGGSVAPAPAASAEELEQWLRAGDEPANSGDAGTDSVTARQAAPAAVTVYRVPRAAFVIACSVAVFVAFLVVARLPAAAVGPVVALLAGAAGVAAVLFPHPAAQAAGACQPGLIAVAAVLLFQAAVRLYYRRRATHLPGFSRALPDPSAPAAPAPVPVPSSRNRPAAVGSSGGGPAAPAGG